MKKSPPRPAAPQRPEMRRERRVARLPAEGLAFDETATEDERAALARRYGVLEVGAFSTSGRIEPEKNGWRMRGVVRARVTQSCVVSLEPVEQVIEEPFSRLYLPGAPDPETLGPDLDPDAEDPPEPLGETLDPGEAAAEAAALAIDPYPRRPGAALARDSALPPGAAPLEEDAPRPFAALAELRARLAARENGAEADAPRPEGAEDDAPDPGPRKGDA
ncbi:YceD family protein [Oceanicella actignis]|uniref:YceD family protein n=1 Tax=Oceanicella actignis TaxID=1189325 RepID=UPI00125556F8|nr:YceD family protein [Oceanicella actignis]TYO91579.1 uncharacterized protein DUF177 involved in 23S rRNA accumulation [Oceanicella actignis]